MRVALDIAAIVSQFVEPGSFLHVCLVDQVGLAEFFQCTVYGSVVRLVFGDAGGDLGFVERGLGIQQYDGDLNPACRAI